MINKNIQTLLNRAGELGWSVSIYESNDGTISVDLGKYSPAGQDFQFSMDINKPADEFLDDIYKYYENYDVSYEAYLWLGPDGHGKSGAPDDMKDLYEDMEACESNIKELYDELSKIELDDEDEEDDDDEEN